MNRAFYYLPMPKIRPKLNKSAFSALADPEIASQIIAATDPIHLERARRDCASFRERACNEP